MKYDCGQTKLHQCLYCNHKVKQRYNLLLHVRARHVEKTEEFKSWYYETTARLPRNSNSTNVDLSEFHYLLKEVPEKKGEPK